jgi:hypothetical protein
MSETSAVVVVPVLARADPDNLELAQLILVDVTNREGRVILQSIWCMGSGGRRVTRIENVANEAVLLFRLRELVPRLFRARLEEVFLEDPQSVAQ